MGELRMVERMSWARGRASLAALLALLGFGAASGCGTGGTSFAEATQSTGSAGSGGAGGSGATGTGGTGGTGGTPMGGGIIEPMGTSLFVNVRDRQGSPIPGAAVVVMGQMSIIVDTISNELGQVLLENLPTGRVVAQVRAAGFTEGTAVANLQAGDHGGALVVLSPLGAPMQIDADVDSVAVKDGVEVAIPAGSIVDSSGQPINGPVDLTIVPIDPTTNQIQAAPGPLEGITEVGVAAVTLESIFMAEVSLWRNGERLKLADGARARISFPVPDAIAARFPAGSTIDAWWFDIRSGYWQREGLGLVQPSTQDPERLVWTAEVEHFTWWNCDEPWDTKHCYNVTVLQSNGTPAQGVPVAADGLSYSGGAWANHTDANGNTCINVMRGGDSRIRVGWYFDPSLPYVDVSASDEISTCEGQGIPCESITINMTSNLVCVPGSWQYCPYSGTPGTEGVGACHAGQQYCNWLGTAWEPCFDEVTPQPEDCATELDDDCSGNVNNGCPIVCANGTWQSCYSGPPGTEGVGVCTGGTRECMHGGTMWGDCIGEVIPGWKWCYIGIDEDRDCDGLADCACDFDWWSTWVECYNGPVGTVNNDGTGVGICRTGMQWCDIDWDGGSYWTGCVGQVMPLPSEICDNTDQYGNFTDDNCSGEVDEPTICCSTAADCGIDTECVTYACVSGTCTPSYTPAGTELPPLAQTEGDCKRSYCDGNGGTSENDDAADVPVDVSGCRTGVCDPGPAFIDIADGSWCSQCANPVLPNGCVCISGACLDPTCSDGILDGDEAGVDCGGAISSCSGCPDGHVCAGNIDCASHICGANSTCQAPACDDGVQNGSETDQDCGGGGCQLCAIGLHCLAGADCVSGVCINSICEAATCNDGILNATETDVDCGGATCATRCANGKHCLINADCNSLNCAVGFMCAP